MDKRQQQPDVVYKDYVIPNLTNNVELAKNDITYTSPFIYNAANYYLSVNRFAISHMSVPLFFFDNSDNKYWVQVGTNVGTRRNLVYSGVGSYKAFGYNNTDFPDPVFYYQQFCTMINTALLASYTAAAGPADNQPFVQYNPNDQKFTLYFSKTALATPNGEIWISNRLFQMIQFWRATYMTDYYIIDVRNNGLGLNNYPALLNTYTPTGSPISYYYIQQERSALYLLNQIQSIAFISNKLPTTKEYVPNLQEGSRHLLNSKSILCNFIPDLSQGRNLSEYQYYTQGQPQLINMTAQKPLTELDIEVYCITKDAKFFPLYLEPGESVNIKLAFYKKSMYNSEYTSLASDRLGITL